MALWILLAALSLSCTVEGSFKKGTCAYPGNLLCDDFNVLNNMSWWYDWHMDLSFYHDKVGQHCNSTPHLVHKHIPMVKKYNNHTQLTIQTWGRFILGFNEPDHADQADMTAQEAAAALPEIEKNSHGAKLVSPTTAGPNFKWYDDFFRLYHGCRISRHICTGVMLMKLCRTCNNYTTSSTRKFGSLSSHVLKHMIKTSNCI
ncbi:uncharacterized protein LOC132756273 isoform X2 [Ruditapes philippinarum]|uniref:uncharacterized protein LOC132756273 isoform X2 n=1 Tax=Ruditapes philippinarum TaxID=129788 RepID=UPI00295AAADC|nr:uncharacterized protein LOC132756273 isoform X2 [Ruditapes philippinarum]